MANGIGRVWIANSGDEGRPNGVGPVWVENISAVGGGGSSFTGVNVSNSLTGDGNNTPLGLNTPVVMQNNESTASYNQYGMSINDGNGMQTLGVNDIRSWNDIGSTVQSNSANWVNVNADWNSTSGDSQILNKPQMEEISISGLEAGSGISITTNASSYVINVTGAPGVPQSAFDELKTSYDALSSLFASYSGQWLLPNEIAQQEPDPGTNEDPGDEPQTTWTCPDCGGSGIVSTCYTCGGGGTVWNDELGEEETCPDCGGSGIVGDHECGMCGGTGSLDWDPTPPEDSGDVNNEGE